MGISVSSLNTAQRVGDALSHGLNNVNAVKETFSKDGDGIKATSNALNSINDFMGVMGTATKGTNAAATVASMTATFNSMSNSWSDEKNPRIKVSDIVNMASDIAALGSAGIPHPAIKLGLGGLSLLLAGLATVIGDDPSIPVDDIKGAINSAMDTFGKVKDGFNDAIGTIGNAIDEAMKPNNNLPLYLDHHSTIPDNLSNPFGNVIQYDPLALDLDNDGKISIIPQQESSVYFDHDGDKIGFRTSWVSPNDGLLVYDKNENNQIDNGNELFGNFTLNSNNEFANNGYEALANLDSDNNGIIDENDSEFANLKVWIDENSDGISQTNELKNLSELEIKSLNLTATEVNQNLGNGNTLVLQGSYTKFDGTTAMSGDIDFSVNTIHREFKDELDLSPEQLARANVKGSGYLRDLKEAAVLNENLANLIDNYSNLSDKSSQLNLLDDIILEWAKTNPNFNEIVEISKTNVSNDPNARDIYLTPTQYRDFLNNNFANLDDENLNEIKHKLAIINSFIGKKYENLYVSSQKDINEIIEFTNSTYEAIKNYIYNSLLTQTRLKEYLNLITLEINEISSSLDNPNLTPSFEFNLNYEAVINKFNEINATNPQKAFVDLAEFIDLYKDKSEISNLMQTLSNFIQAAIKNEQIGEFLRDLGDDIIQKHKDLFIDIITNNKNIADLIIAKSNYVKTNKSSLLIGTDTNDEIRGSDYGDTVYAEAGDDLIYCYGGDNIIYTQDGNDRVFASNGNDILVGGKGNDNLCGDRGDDIYIFNLGDGNDQIYDSYGNDTIKFGKGISKEDLIVSRMSDYGTNEGVSSEGLQNLLIKFKNSPNDSILIKYAFEKNQTSNKGVIENFVFFDGTTLNFQDIKNLALQNPLDKVIRGFDDQKNEIIANDKDNQIYSGNKGDIIYAGDGNDLIYCSSGDDTIYGEDGNDSIFASNGNDILVGGKGNDNLCGDRGDDTYIFNKGDGKDVVLEFEGNDTIKFGPNLSANEIKFNQNQNNLIIKYSDQDQITITNYFLGRTRSGDYIVENFELDDGSILTSNQINKIIQDFHALNTQNNSEFDGFSFSDIQNNSNSLQIYW